METVIVSIFLIVALLTLFEKYLKQYRLPIYILIGVALVLTAGLREVGIDPDSMNYEYSFLHWEDMTIAEVEYSHNLISQLLSNFSRDVHSLFIVYALLGVGIKLFAITKYSNMWFLPLMVYVSYYFPTHECMQIRTGVLSAIMLLEIVSVSKGEKVKAAILIAIGFFFHMSALVLIPTLFLKNNEFTKKQLVKWGAVIPAAYLLYFMGFSLLLNLPFDIPGISDKLEAYKVGTERGLVESSINVFSPFLLFTIMLFYLLLIFNKTITKHNKYYPILMKYFAIGLFSYVAFAFLPVLAERLNMLFQAVTILLYASLYYIIKPRWAGLLLVILICLINMNYAFGNLGMVLFWKV